MTCQGQPKTTKGEAYGWLTGILHLAPATQSVPFGGFNTCPNHTPQCKAVCLNTSGHGGIPQKRNDGHLNQVQAARVARTVFFLRNRHDFLEQLRDEIWLLEQRAKKRGLRAAVRLNGTSDLPWEKIYLLCGKTLMEEFPKVKFYDYTKSRERARKQPYPLTYSRSENDRPSDLSVLLSQGINVAIVFKEVPKKWMGHRVVDGDKHDLRFKDPKGVVVGLRAKGKARRHEGGFVL